MRETQKGIYIAQKKNRSIFLLQDGRFIHGTPAAPLSIGEEGSFYPITAKPKSKWRPIFAPAIAAVAIFLLFFSAMLPSKDAFAYVQLEMNSSVEFGVDKAIRVISVRELDAGGKKLIDKLGDWKGEALDKLIERSIAISVKDETEKVTITTAAEESSDTAGIKLEEMVLAASAAAVKKDIGVHVKKATFAQWEKSIEEDIPVGQKVENFIAVDKEEKSETDRDQEINIDNDLKELKTKKNQSSVKSKITGQEKDVKPEPAANMDKEKASDEKKKPFEKNVESPAAGKAGKLVPPENAEKAKQKGTSPKVKAIEKKPEMTPEPSEKAKPAVNGHSRSMPMHSNPGKATADKQKQKLPEKAKLKPKEKAVVKSIQKEKTIAKGKQKGKAEPQGKQREKAADAKPIKAAKAETRHSQIQQPKQPSDRPEGKIAGEKGEQK